ncbi:AarF/ABC1/UbiB kinase family protein [Flammeovirgaceae bacterium SG7u.111]|nr:AarF/ABC1/UbiB kinase family protein [Flammeovirgaceae bacterium SG7u.132]WPO36995.1 AarF/ABC1/UbiB kinase family protein [Flammeovirgaceae bacterium SG7u.111]
MFFDKTVQNINRLRELIKVLGRYGFEDIVVNTALRKFISAKKRVAWTRSDISVFELTRWERIRMVIEELGPTFVKLAQLLSNRPDILPSALIAEFAILQDKVPPFEGAEARRIVEEETGKTIEELFAYFDEVPLGSASIGQVHRARLKTGEDVVVKVQRPGVKEKVKTDLALLREFVRLAETYFKKAGILNPLDIVDAFERSMYKELDYNIEAANLLNFKKLYKKEKEFYIPKVYRDFTTNRVLTIEFISGCKITNIEQLTSWGLEPEKIAEKGLDIYLKQIFEFGYFHADPHPGNVLVRPNGEIVLIDFGMVGKLTQQQKFAFSGVFIGLASQDAKGIALNLRRLAIDSDVDDDRKFEMDIVELIEDMVIFANEDEGMSELTGRLQKIIYNYQLKVQGSVFLILRALAILEGIGKKLHPKFEVMEFIKPYGVKVVKEQYSLKAIGLDLYYTSSQFASLLYNLPFEIRSIVRKVRKGTLHLNIDHHGYEPLLDRIDFATNKLVISLIIMGLLVSSAISISMPFSENMPYFFGIPFISLLGLSTAIFLGVLLFFYMLRKP